MRPTHACSPSFGAARLDGVRNAVLIADFGGAGRGNRWRMGRSSRARSGLAGEFGHPPMWSRPAPICGCGQRGCWEVFASSNAALRYYAELVPKGRPLKIQELLHMAEEGDEPAIAAVSRQCRALGQGLRLVTAAAVSGGDPDHRRYYCVLGKVRPRGAGGVEGHDACRDSATTWNYE